ncbi:PFA3 Palmitoyltransferase PFA3 [Candida maltosa Xu316]
MKQHGSVFTLITCVLGLYGTFLTWSILQERINTKPYGSANEYFQSPLVINIIQSLFASITGLVYNYFTTKSNPFNIFLDNGKQNSSVFKYMILISITSSLASPIGYKSLNHLDYLAYLLAKSCKLIPVMVVHFVFYQTKFPVYKYLVAALVTFGVILFTMSHASKKTKVNDGNTLLGFFYLVGSMILDGLTNSSQDQLFKLKLNAKITGGKLMCILNFLIFIWTTLYTLGFQSQEIKESLVFAHKYPELLVDLIGFAICGGIGQIFVFIILEKFDSIILITATVTRKMLSMILSVILFGHFLTIEQWLGVSLVFGGIGYEALIKLQQKRATKSKIIELLMAILYKYSMISDNSYMISFENACCFLATLFPKVFCTSVLTWSLFVLLFIIPTYISSSLLFTTLSIIGITLYSLCIFTYYRIILVGPGSPLDYPELKIENLNHITENPFDNDPEEMPPDFMILHTMKVNGNQGFRYCNKCSVWKPDRSHHCSSSGKCILKMDHYCPWFSTCIGFFNHKFFIQFLCYVAVYCLFLFTICATIFYNFIVNGLFEEEILSINLALLLVVSFAFSIAVSVFAIFSLYLCSKNLTTIEFQEKRWNYGGGDRFNYEFDTNGKQKKLANIFDLGVKENFKQVLGPNLWTWILPINVNQKSVVAEYRNGINFKVDEEVYAKYLHNVELQQQLNDQLRSYKDRVRRERESNNIIDV